MQTTEEKENNKITNLIN